MVRGGAWNWPLRFVLVALCAVVPWFAGLGYALIVLLALPVLRALLDAANERLTTWLCVAGAYVAGGFLLPEWLWPAVSLWCAGLIAMSLLRVPAGSKTIRAGAVLAAGTGMLTVALASVHYGGQLIPGLAQGAVDLVDQHPNSTELLLNAYRSGLARLEGDQALVPALRFLGIIIMPADVRVQLLYSLRGTLEIMLKNYLPPWLVGWMLLTALVPALALEGCLKGRGLRSDLPPLERWYLPDRMAVGAAIMLVLSWLTYMTESPPLGYLGAMCGTLGYWAWAVQGASTLMSILTARQMRPVFRGLLIAAAVVLAPLALLLLGCYDQFRDPRHLRGSRNETI